MRIISLASLLILVAGCLSPEQIDRLRNRSEHVYKGKERPLEELATIEFTRYSSLTNDTKMTFATVFGGTRTVRMPSGWGWKSTTHVLQVDKRRVSIRYLPWQDDGSQMILEPVLPKKIYVTPGYHRFRVEWILSVRTKKNGSFRGAGLFAGVFEWPWFGIECEAGKTYYLDFIAHWGPSFFTGDVAVRRSGIDVSLVQKDFNHFLAVESDYHGRGVEIILTTTRPGVRFYDAADRYAKGWLDAEDYGVSLSTSWEDD